MFHTLKEINKPLYHSDKPILIIFYLECEIIFYFSFFSLSLECLCNLDEDTLSQNHKMIMKATNSKTVIDRFVKSKMTSESNIASLEKVRNIDDVRDRKKELLKFLMNEKTPKVFFCILEEEIIRAERQSVIQSILKGIYLLRRISIFNIIKSYCEKDYISFHHKCAGYNLCCENLK